MDQTTSVALYARVSSQRQADELTILSQTAALEQRIEQDGLRIEEERCFRDEGYTGSSLLRPAPRTNRPKGIFCCKCKA